MAVEKYFKGLSSHLLAHCREGFLCDTVVIAGGISVRVHGILLAAASSQLKQLLDKQRDDDVRYLVLTDVDYVGLCVAIYFIYTGNLVLPADKDEEYYAVLKTSLLNLGLCSGGFSECNVFYERNDELDFISHPCSKLFSDMESDGDSDLDDDILHIDAPVNHAQKQRGVTESDGTAGNHLINDTRKNSSSKNKKYRAERGNSQVDRDICEIFGKNNIKEECIGDDSFADSDNDIIFGANDTIVGANDSNIVSENETGDETGVLDYVKSMKSEDEFTNKQVTHSTETLTQCKSKEACNVEAMEKSVSVNADQIQTQKKHNMQQVTRRKVFKVIRISQSGVEEIKNNSIVTLVHSENSENSDVINSSELLELNVTSGETNRQLYRCPKCFKLFKTRYTLKKHISSHNVGAIGRSKIISRIISETSRPRKLIPVPESAMKYECEKCSRKFSLARHLELHQLQHTDAVTSRSCPHCGKILKTRASLLSHMRTHAPSNTFSSLCHICGKEFKSQSSMRKHMAKPHGNYKCDMCDASYNTKQKLSHHCLLEHGIYISCRTTKDRSSDANTTKAHLCYTCGRSFSGLKSYLTHRLEHRKNCSLCGKMCEGDAELEDHMVRDHPGEEWLPPNWCSICEKSFKLERHLKDHMLRHNEVRPFLCKTCGDSFISISQLGIHVRKNHSGEILHSRLTPRRRRPYKSRQPYKPRRPKCSNVIRLDARSFQCIECGAVLKSHSAMQSHVANHAGKSLFNCTTCDKSFLSNQTLEQHVRIHTGEKPYTCRECGKCFRQTAHLTRHLHQHRGTKPYYCEVCGKGYSNSLDRRHHYSRVHNLEIQFTKVNKNKAYTVNFSTSTAATTQVLSSTNITATEAPSAEL